jgi:hypothetical protein
MAKRKPKPKKSRPTWRKPRAAKKDDRGVRLTSDQRHIAFLPSDFAQAMRQPPEAPTRATRKLDPQQPTTEIPDLRVMPLTPFAYQCVVEAINAADRIQVRKLNPTGGANLRYRIEIAAAFLAHILHHGFDAGAATGWRDPKEFSNLAFNLAIRRAQQIYAQDSA